MAPRIAVVGAGPAGTSFVLYALRQGVAAEDLVLLDKATFPRPKLCGGGISERRAARARSGFASALPSDATVELRPALVQRACPAGMSRPLSPLRHHLTPRRSPPPAVLPAS
jgi:glycine/D-amino acid oxidase-like deaminating enzyme